MKKEVIAVDEFTYGIFGDREPKYITEDGKVYIPGLNLKLEQIEEIGGGVEKGGKTYIRVKY